MRQIELNNISKNFYLLNHQIEGNFVFKAQSYFC
jgi:hypothetical protein